MTWECAIELAGRNGTQRCASRCESCKQRFLKGADNRPLLTMETAGGLYFDYGAPLAEQVTLDDVAHHLSLTPRFGGATRDAKTGRPILYSVAEHAMQVRQQVIDWGYGHLALAALHHDSHEFILGDWPTPLKRLLRTERVTVLDELVAKTNAVIAERFGISVGEFGHPVVKRADMLLLYREAATFKGSLGVGEHWGREEPAEPLDRAPVPPWLVKQAFVLTHRGDGGRE